MPTTHWCGFHSPLPLHFRPQVGRSTDTHTCKSAHSHTYICAHTLSRLLAEGGSLSRDSRLGLPLSPWAGLAPSSMSSVSGRLCPDTHTYSLSMDSAASPQTFLSSSPIPLLGVLQEGRVRMPREEGAVVSFWTLLGLQTILFSEVLCCFP